MSTRLLIGSMLMAALLLAPAVTAAPSGGACSFGICPGFRTQPFGQVEVCVSGTLVGCLPIQPAAPLPAPIPSTPLGCVIVSSVAGNSLPGATAAQVCA